ncbi:autophagy-related protein 16-2 isoform X3 [Heterocephalus glaber]|uniref:Protein Atg16l2 n=2 Tax=Heterocephalus glaber TaxID=10181 RepID=A0AAX6Q268_HETGA|nr:autophagy-related protein 16-2 isoform X3 [Heterocephalus glaber]
MPSPPERKSLLFNLFCLCAFVIPHVPCGVCVLSESGSGVRISDWSVGTRESIFFEAWAGRCGVKDLGLVAPPAERTSRRGGGRLGGSDPEPLVSITPDTDGSPSEVNDLVGLSGVDPRRLSQARVERSPVRTLGTTRGIPARPRPSGTCLLRLERAPSEWKTAAMAGSGGLSVPDAPAALWKRHIMRELRQRDRTQKALFLELVPAYNHLLEKAELLATFSEKLHLEPSNVTPASDQGSWEEESRPESDQVPSLATLKVKWQEEEEGLRLVCGEMAYQVVEKSAALGTQQLQLEERQGRLAVLEAQVAHLQEARAKQTQLVEEQRAQNVVQRTAYEVLRVRTGNQEAELRRLQEEASCLLERLVQLKARAADELNLRLERLERASQARVSQELKKAAKRTVSISEIPDSLGKGIREGTEALTLAAKPDSLESKACEKWKRPFRSASATSLTLSCCVDVVKGLLDFKKRRGHSIGGVPEQQYQSIPICVAAKLPVQALDVLDAHLSEVNAVHFGPNSNLLATGGADRLIHLWNIVGGRLEANQTLEGAGGSITSVDIDPSGSQVLAATYNQAAQLWKVGEAHSKETLSGHKDKVTAAKFKLTRHQAVTGSRDRTVKEWDLGRAYCSRTINVLSYCNDVVCGDHIIISGHNDQKIRFWDSRGPCCTQVIPVQGRVTSLSLSNDQLNLLSCSRDDTLKVIDLRVSNVRQVFRADGFKCGSDWTKAVFSPDRRYALAGSWDGALYIWDVDTGKLESTLQGPHCVAVNAVAWCCSGSHVVSVDQGRKVVLWH